MMRRNVIVAQSGGPSPVINSSLRGVIETCKLFPETFGTIYGGWHGIEGFLGKAGRNGQGSGQICPVRRAAAREAVERLVRWERSLPRSPSRRRLCGSALARRRCGRNAGFRGRRAKGRIARRWLTRP